MIGKREGMAGFKCGIRGEAGVSSVVREMKSVGEEGRKLFS